MYRIDNDAVNMLDVICCFLTGSGKLQEVMRKLGTCNGLIVDVPSNSGGLLTAASKLASLFVNETTIGAYMCHKTGSGHNDFSAPEPIELKPFEGLRWQKPVAVQRGFAQHAANGASLCGDCAEAFTDGSGRYISVLSDGMGTGGRAAVDGTMTAGMAQSLLKAGIGFESTLKMINSAMLAKGGEESLATLDVACIDLFTGHVSLRKAGAAGTVLRRRKKTEYLEAKSVPVGILPEIAFARSEKDLDAGDMLVMVSDGVTASGTEWLCDLIANYEDDDPQALSERIVERAVKDRADGHEDDVSAVVLLIE